MLIKTRLLMLHVGRDFLHEGWTAGLILLPRRDLMTEPGDQGRWILCALRVTVCAWWGFRPYEMRGDGCHRHLCTSWRVWSDVDAITTRVARIAGQID